jgi:tRNA threonylcarbamoyladenosine biosynthesis protein TsaE
MSTAIDINDLAAMETFGRSLGSTLAPGSVVALVGPLGAGKTHLARAIVQGIGIDDCSIVTSPTFTLVQEYAARIPVYHFDTYRLKCVQEFEDLGAVEMFHSGGVCLVEWADRVSGVLPADHVRIEIEVVDASRRRLKIMTDHEKQVNHE